MFRRATSVASLLLTLTACSLPAGGTGAAALPPGGEPVPQSGTPVSTPRPSPTTRPTPTPDPVVAGRGVPATGAWLLHRGPVAQLGDLAAVSAAYGVVAIEADPGMARATAADVKALQAGGRTKVLAWLSVAVAEADRPVWQRNAALVQAASLGPRAGRPGETWIDPSDNGIRLAILGQLAKPIADAGVDGFLIADLSLAEHLQDAQDGPCSGTCRQGLFDLVQDLRKLHPAKLMVAYGATGDAVRLATAANNQAVPGMLDGVVGEAVYAPARNELVEADLAAWKAMGLTVNGQPFWIGTADAVPSCDAAAAADAARRAREAGFVPSVGTALDASRRACPTP